MNNEITPWDMYINGVLGNYYIWKSGNKPETAIAEQAAQIANELIKFRPKTPKELGIND